MEVKDLPVEIKVAGYQKSRSNSIQTDWCLDACKDLYKNSAINDTVKLTKELPIIMDQISKWGAELIVTDLESTANIVAMYLKIPMVVFTSQFANWMSQGRNITTVSALESNFSEAREIIYYTHFTDVSSVEDFKLRKNIKVCRPLTYSVVGDIKYDALIVLRNPTAEKLNWIKIFSKRIVLTDQKILMDDAEYYMFDNTDIWFSLLGKCEYVICGGESLLLSDAYYNNRKVGILQDSQIVGFEDNVRISEKLYTAKRQVVSRDINLPVALPPRRKLSEVKTVSITEILTSFMRKGYHN
jgi:phosphohistidine swiveling domain-containing protein